MEMIQGALNQLNHLCLQNKKTLKHKYPVLTNELSSVDEESKELAAAQHMYISKYIHTIDLMRWYGKFQNNGQYNKDGFLAILQKLKELYNLHGTYKQKIKKAYPSLDFLRKVYVK